MIMGMWQNHRNRQAGKYQKQAALQMQQLVAQQQATAAPAAPQVNPQAIGQEAYGRGWREGWQAGQRDLVNAIRQGRLTWDEVCRRIPG